MIDKHILYVPGLEDIQSAFRGPPIPSQLLPPLPLDQLLIKDQSLLLSQQGQGFLVLL